MKIRNRLLTDDRGLSLVEMLIASALFIVIVFAVLSTLESATKAERISQARNDAQGSLRDAMTEMTRDTRQATYVDPSSTGSLIAMCSLKDGTEFAVAYQVSGSTLKRMTWTGSCPRPLITNGVLPAGAGTTNLSTHIVASNFVSGTPWWFCYHFDEQASPPCLAPTMAALGTDSVSAIRLAVEVTPVVFSRGDVTLATDVQLRNVGS